MRRIRLVSESTRARWEAFGWLSWVTGGCLVDRRGGVDWGRAGEGTGDGRWSAGDGEGGSKRKRERDCDRDRVRRRLRPNTIVLVRGRSELYGGREGGTRGPAQLAMSACPAAT